MSFEWVPCINYNIPPRAVKCGKDFDGSEIYIGQAQYGYDVLPVKIVPRRREAYISYAGFEYKVNEFKVLVERSFRWKSASDGNVPNGAIPAGTTRSGEILYVGRAQQGPGVTVIGKVHKSHRCLYVPYDGKEVAHKTYEVLVLE